MPALLAALLCTAGCATVDRKVELNNAPPSQTAAFSGVIYLAPTEEPPLSPGNRGGQDNQADISDKEGGKQGRVLSDASLADLLMRALAAELKNAGYSVVLADRMPVDATKGITLGSVKIKPNETANPLKAATGGSVGFVAELRRNGKVFASLNYSTLYKMSADKDGETQLPDTVQFFLDHAVHETIGLLKQK